MENFKKAMLEVGTISEMEGYGSRIFHHIKLNEDYRISIQCSASHYCTPRILADIDTYTTYEVAIIGIDGFTNPKELDNFDRKEELDQCCSYGVFGYVPTDLVEDLFNFMRK